jgi:hypothetical protein
MKIQKFVLVPLLAVTMVAGLAGSASAQEVPSGNNYTTAISDFGDDWQEMINVNGPKLMGILVLGLGFSFVWKKIKTAART